MKRLTLLVLLVPVLLTGLAHAATPPFADAGLDQTVERDATVRLDASRSRDPNGAITSYKWSIETPGGSTTTPECPTCKRTWLHVTDTGTYRATVTVTDDDGQSRSDTLEITVEPPHPPAVSLSGPEKTTTGTSVTYEASVDPGDADLARVVWKVDDKVVKTTRLDDDERTDEYTRTFDSESAHRVSATVTDIEGRHQSDDEAIGISSSGGGGGGRIVCGFEKGLDGGDRSTFGSCDTGDKMYDMPDGKYFVDLNGDGKIVWNGRTICRDCNSIRGNEIDRFSELPIKSSIESPSRVNNHNGGSDSSGRDTSGSDTDNGVDTDTSLRALKRHYSGGNDNNGGSDTNSENSNSRGNTNSGGNGNSGGNDNSGSDNNDGNDNSGSDSNGGISTHTSLRALKRRYA